MRKDKCPFTGGEADLKVVEGYLGLYQYFTDMGNFLLTNWARKYLEQLKLPNPILLHGIYENLKARDQNYQVQWKLSAYNPTEFKPGDEKGIVQKDLDMFEDVPIDHAFKLDGVMALVGAKLKDKGPFDSVIFTAEDGYRLKCADKVELMQWVETLRSENRYLRSRDAAIGSRVMSTKEDEEFEYTVTPSGWAKIRSLTSGGTGRKAFIAMAFSNNKKRSEIQDSIEKACGALGWDAFTIDKKEYLGRVTDEIIASINQSRFIVAEFTENNHGVYYEAGYAAGKGIPVIYVVSEGDLQDLHFDTSQINHIVWTTPEDLRKKLKVRLELTVGGSGILG